MRRLLLGIAILFAVAVMLVVGHLAFIEIGREVVTLRTQNPDGSWRETRLWIVDQGGTPWLHSGGASWLARFDGDPIVELKRNGEIRRYRAHPMPGPHPEIDLALRAKYGVADRGFARRSPDDEAWSSFGWTRSSGSHAQARLQRKSVRTQDRNLARRSGGARSSPSRAPHRSVPTGRRRGPAIRPRRRDAASRSSPLRSTRPERRCATSCARASCSPASTTGRRWPPCTASSSATSGRSTPSCRCRASSIPSGCSRSRRTRSSTRRAAHAGRAVRAEVRASGGRADRRHPARRVRDSDHAPSSSPTCCRDPRSSTRTGRGGFWVALARGPGGRDHRAARHRQRAGPPCARCSSTRSTGARTRARRGGCSIRCSSSRGSAAFASSSSARPPASSPPTASTRSTASSEIPKHELPSAFPVMEVDVKFYRRSLGNEPDDRSR